MSPAGDPAAVSAAATGLRTASTVAEEARALVADATPEVWTGEAADAYTAAVAKTVDSAQSMTDALASASATLTRYAAVQTEAAAAYAQAQADYDTSLAKVRSNPLDLLAGLDLVQSRLAAFGALGRLQLAASTAAAELRAVTDDAEDGEHPWWDPFGWWTDTAPLTDVSEDIMDDDAFDPDDIAQGQIGDCFMLSSIVSLLNTDGGDEFIRENVRWDEEAGGFWVTLYPNGEPEEVFVDKVFGEGAKQDDWEFLFFSGDKPSIAALYEAALYEKYGYDYIDGGVPEDAMRIITGDDVQVVQNDNYSGLSPRQTEELRENLDEGGQVVLSSPRSGEHRITVAAGDGSTREIDLVNTHSYAVTRIEPDGSVWMRNPWGPGNSADGGGEFRVSAEDVEDLFWRATYTNVTD